MNPNGFLYRSLTFLLSFLIMSFAWPLRGQFGHEWGALITGAMAASVVCILIPQNLYRRAFAQAVFFGAIGFVIGGENIPYGALVEDILKQPDLKSALPQLLTVFFIGASWGCIGTTYLGYGICEQPMTLRDYGLILIAGIAALVAALILGDSNLAIFITMTALIIFLQGYNLMKIHSKIVTDLGISGFLGFGFGFFIAVVILYLGNKGLLPGPSGWWTLRDQIWGGIGGFGIILAAWCAVGKNLQPIVLSPTWVQRIGFSVFIPLICGWNTYDVYAKWFQSTPPAPNLQLAGLLILIGVLLLTAWLITYWKIAAQKFGNPLLLASFLFFSFYLAFFAIAKSILYSGWGVWETGFTLFLFDTTVLLCSIPFILLGNETLS